MEGAQWTEAVGTTGDTAFFVFTDTGAYTVSAIVTVGDQSCTVSKTVTILDCNGSITEFPYVIDFNQGELLPECWQKLNLGTYGGYYYNSSGYLNIILESTSDDLLISPPIDPAGSDSCWLQFKFRTDNNTFMTVGVSQGGTQADDFIVADTMPLSDTWTTSQPLNLSRYWNGTPLRIAIGLAHTIIFA